MTDASLPAGSLNTWSATAIAAAVAVGTVSAREVLDACLAQIDRLDPEVEAWAYLDVPPARARADAIDRAARRGEGGVGALAGVPVGIKDTFNTAGMPCEMGSPIWRGFTPGNDARVVHYLRMAGALFPGKTVTAEFAVHAPGPTHNPHRHGFAPGTSSSGSAAAVAAYMVPVAIGTQTAGSIIRPASYCGVYGFKPSFGAVPRTGMLKTTDTLDTIGWFAREVADIAATFSVMRVHGADFPILERAYSDTVRQRKSVGQPWRVGLVRGPNWSSALPETRAAVETFAGQLAAIDAVEVIDATLPAIVGEARATHATLYDRSLAYYFKEEFREHTLVSSSIYDIITRGNRLSLDDYRSALAHQQRIAAELDAWLMGYDLLLDMATAAEAAEGLDTVDMPDHALIWTLAHLPAISVPVLRGHTGLPLGVQFVARRYNDPLMLDFLAMLDRRGVLPRRTAPDLSPAFLLAT